MLFKNHELILVPFERIPVRDLLLSCVFIVDPKLQYAVVAVHKCKVLRCEQVRIEYDSHYSFIINLDYRTLEFLVV